MRNDVRRLLALLLCLLLTAPLGLALAETDAEDDAAWDAAGWSEEDDQTDAAPADPPADDAAATGDEYQEWGDEGAELPDEDVAPEDIAAPEATATEAPAVTGSATDIIRKCKAKVSEGKAAAIADGKVGTAWTASKKGAKLQITIPAKQTVQGVWIQWYAAPTGYSITEYGSDGKEIATTDESAQSFAALERYYPLDAATKRILITLKSKGQGISELKLFTQGALPEAVHEWEAPVEKADLLLLVAHPDDEWLYMGGMIPYYHTVRGLAVQTVYVAATSRARQNEALNGLWAAGVRNYPVFLNFGNKATKNLPNALKVWNEEKLMASVVEQIRVFRPDVLVSMDLKGEAGLGAHMATAYAAQKAVTAAADAAQYTDSASYGAWSVQKLYLHLYEENAVTMDWKTAYDELNGKTPLGVAQMAYEKHTSKKEGTAVADGGATDNAKFGLAYTAVGADTSLNDLFENVTMGAIDQTPQDMGAGGFIEDSQGDDMQGVVDEDILAAAADAFKAPTETEAPIVQTTPVPTEAPVPEGFRVRDDLKPLKTFGIAVGVVLGLTAIVFGGRALLNANNGALKKKIRQKLKEAETTTVKKKKGASGKKTAPKKTPAKSSDDVENF